MSGGREQTTGSSDQERYEATVLDFLNKEATGVPQSKKPGEYSDELNALVSDLLKQVIKEAAQQSGPAYEPDKVEDLLSEFMPLQEAVPVKAATNPEPALPSAPSEQAIPISEKKAVCAERPVETKEEPPEAGRSAASTPSSRPGSLFAAPALPKRGIPKMTVAIAAVLLVAGIAGFLFYRVSNRGLEPSGSASLPTTAPPADAGVLQSVEPSAAPGDNLKQATPAPGGRTTAGSMPEKASAPAPKIETASGAPIRKPDAVMESPAPAPQRMDSPPAVVAFEPPAPTEPSAAVTAPIEKPAAAAISEAAKTAEAPAEKASVQDIAIVSASPAAASPEPKPSAATTPRNATSAIPLVRVNPQYPELALRTRASASVTLDVSIDSQGKVLKAIPVSGPAIFHNEAVKAALKWRYKPASIDGTNVSSRSTITFNFNLKN